MTRIIGGIEMEPNWQDKPAHPIREALASLCGGKNPPKFVKGYDYNGLDDHEHHALQDWAASHCIPTWGTVYGVLDAALAIVQAAVDNGNIPPRDSKWRITDGWLDVLVEGNTKTAKVHATRNRKEYEIVSQQLLDGKPEDATFEVFLVKKMKRTPVELPKSLEVEADVAREASVWDREKDILVVEGDEEEPVAA